MLKDINAGDHEEKQSDYSIEKHLVITNAPPAILTVVSDFWQKIIKFYAPIRPGHISGWAASIHYYLCRHYGSTLTQEKICLLYNISLHTMRNRLSKIRRLDLVHLLPAGEIDIKAQTLKINGELFYDQEWLLGQKAQRKIDDLNLDHSAARIAAGQKIQVIHAKSISDKRWLEVIALCRELVTKLYSNSELIEIKHFLKHVQANMALAGYAFKSKDLEYTFGRLFSEMELTAVKGRNPEKFVTLYDRSGRGEPFVYLQLPQHG